VADEWVISGRTVVITGGNSGVGKEAAVDLAKQGAVVTITSRSPDKGEAALREIRRRSGNESADVMRLDLASFDSIRAFAEEANARFDRLDVLINNAGGILSYRQQTSEHFEMTFGVNHLGHFLLTDLLLDKIKASAPSRIINVASLAHRMAGGMSWNDLQHEKGYSGTAAYNESKLANVLFTIELARRLEGTGVTVNACHPGPVRTGFGGSDDTKGFERYGMMIARPFLIGPKRGSIPLVYLAASPKVADITGQYFSRWPLSGLPFASVSAHTAARAARDPDAPKRLWDESEKLIASV
jgi:NAD(P)-dependent dehydrogenase (short-subunit alcohol dehydrogenase family)